jgi:hypothetical protein
MLKSNEIRRALDVFFLLMTFVAISAVVLEVPVVVIYAAVAVVAVVAAVVTVV